MKPNKHVSLFLLFAFMLTIVSWSGVSVDTAIAGTALKDIQNHWAAASIQEMVDAGIVSGYTDGSFKPENNISRAEFAVLIVKTFQFEMKDGKVFTDTAKHWAKDYIAAANAKGVLSGYSDTKFGPDDPITREQMAVMVVAAAGLQNSPAESNFNDSSSISNWAKEAVAAASAKGIITGFPDGTFQPQANATRAQAVIVLKKAHPDITSLADISKLDKAGTYGPAVGTQSVDYDVTISADGVKLQNAVISGDLLITDAVGDGEVTLKNVTVKGTTYIKGGGADSVYLDDCTLGKVVINKKDNNIRVVLEGSTTISNLVADSGAKIVGKATITKAAVNANKVEIETKPGTVAVAASITAIIAGETIVGTSSGGGGGGGPSVTQLTVSASPKPGAITAGDKVTLTASVAGADIYYTIDGSTPTTSSDKYTAPITVNSDLTIKAIAEKSGYATSAVTSFGYTIAQIDVMSITDAEYIMLKGVIRGTVTEASVTKIIATDDQGNEQEAKINPDRTFEVSNTHFVDGKHITLQGYNAANEVVGSVSVVIGGEVAPPITGPTSIVTDAEYIMLKGVIRGTVTEASVTKIIATDDQGNEQEAKINPDRTFEVSNTHFVDGKHITLQGYNAANVAIGDVTKTIIGDSSQTQQVAAVTATPEPGAVAEGTTVTLECATPGATIYYTVDNTSPTKTSTLYADPIVIDAAKTIKAIAVKSGMTDSSVSSFAYTVSASDPALTVISSKFLLINGVIKAFL